jgi:pyruvate kinase
MATTQFDDGDPARLLDSLGRLRAAATNAEAEFADELDALPPSIRASACNLAHYLGVRRHDIRPLQDDLAAMGLSSLGRLESHVLPTLDAVLDALRHMQGETTLSPATFRSRFAAGDARLSENTEVLLGRAPTGRSTRIMVTMPTEAATDARLVRDLVEAGMGVMRINCAHDDAPAWRAMVTNLRAAEAATGRSCRVLTDLGGPKLRTGTMRAAPRTLRLRPTRDAAGRTIGPLRLWFTRADAPIPASDAGQILVPVHLDGPLAARPGDRVHLVDARGRRRTLAVATHRADAFEAYCAKGLRLEQGLTAELEHADGSRTALTLGALGTAPEAAVLETGDRVHLRADPAPGRDAVRDDEGVVIEPAELPCTLPEVFADVRPGECVRFDDGRIEGVVEAASPERLVVRVTRARERGARLAGDKGINLPDSRLSLPPLTERDLADLDVVVELADLVGMSFVRDPEDVRTLRRELAARGAEHLGVMLKIETRDAFEHLPRILLAGLGPSPLGVMVARGDLAVEIGFERLAEVQEEILWFSEAAHVPVVWATQVLDTLARKGAPSRAEVTDAAMGGRAECVMLNKGPHVVDAVRFLDDVLARMQAHQHKKTAMLRALHVSR